MSQNQYQVQTVMLDGGIDSITPSITAAPGTLSACLNFERTDRIGYSRCFGFEKFDGAGNSSLAYTNMAYVHHTTSPTTTPPRSAIWIDTDGDPVVLGYVVECSTFYTLIAIENYSEWDRVRALLPSVTLVDSSGVSRLVGLVSTFDEFYRTLQPDPEDITAEDLTLARNQFFEDMDSTVTHPGSGRHPTIGLHGYKDQLYAVVDLDTIYFTGGNEEFFPGDWLVATGQGDENKIVVLDYKLLSGSFSTDDAVGIILTNQPQNIFTGSVDILRPTSTVANALTFANAPSGTDTTPWSAGLWRTNNYNQSQASGEPEGWNPIDAGYEFGFENGSEFGPPILFNRGEFQDEDTDVIASTDTADDGVTTDSTLKVDGSPIPGDSWSIEGAATVAEAVQSDEDTSFVIRSINNTVNPIAMNAGNMYLTNFSSFTGFAGSSNLTVKGIEVTVVCKFVSTDGNPRNSTITVAPCSGTTQLPNSVFEQKSLGYDNGVSAQPKRTLVFGGPDSLFGLSAEDMKAAMDSDWGMVVQPWVTRSNSNYYGDIYIYYVGVKVYYTITITGYYFWNGVDDVTGKITNYIVTDGDWSTNDAQGTMQIIDVEPVGSANRRNVMVGDEIWTEPGGNGLRIADVSSSMVATSLESLSELEENKSRYEIITANFFANADFEAFYGVSGAGRAFSYDGFYFKHIYAIADDALDKPRHIAFHQFHLALGYISGAVLLSSSGNPYDFDGVNGAVEIDVGDPVTGLVRMNGTTLGVFCKKSVHGIVGTSSDNFSRQILSPYEGAIEYTVLDMGHPVYCSYRGISIFDQTDAYGDFAGNRLSTIVNPWLLPRIQGTVAPLGEVAASSGPVVALSCRTKNQYRLYFQDGYRLTMTLIGGSTNQPQFTIQAESLYSPSGEHFTYIIPRAETSFVDNTGAERIYISHYSDALRSYSQTYWVYEYDRSWTFDGYGIPAYVVSNENFYGTAGDYDKFNKIRLLGMSLGYAPINVHVENNYKENFSVDQNIRLLGPLSLPRNPAATLASDYVNTTNICNIASDGRSFNFRLMSYDIERSPIGSKDPLYADVCPPFVIQGMLVQTKEGKGDV